MITTSFSLTEEAFVLRSLKEVVNVWAMGSGKATFTLNIDKGTADLKLGFQLGCPTDAHLPNQPHLNQNLAKQYRQGKRKSPSQRRRDQTRAARHQAAAAAALMTQNPFEAAPAPAVMLPFVGNILPILPTPSAPQATAPVASPPPSRPPAASVAAPTKAVVETPAGKFKRYVDMSLAKKNLFPADEGHQHLPPSQDVFSTKYRKEEDKLMEKLFSL